MGIAALPAERLHPASSQRADPSGEPAPPAYERVAGWLQGNRLFTGALAVAALLRLLVMAAYPPALEFFGDSPSYLGASRHPLSLDIWHPFGYPLFLWLLSPLRSVAVVTLVQHGIGLAAGFLVYRLVRGMGVGSVGGTLAAAPLLFDAYQLDNEQFLLSDTLFTLLVVVTAVLTVRLLRRPTAGGAIWLGAALGAATLTRTAGLTVTVAVLVVLALARVGVRTLAIAAVAAAVPIGGYAVGFHATYGVYELQGYGGRYLYGQVAPFAHCNPASLPVDLRPLCPTLPTYARPGVNQYVWHQFTAAHLPGDQIEGSELAGKFARPIAIRQAGDVATAAFGNFVHYFEPMRRTGARDWPVGSWQFPLADNAPMWNIHPAQDGFRAGDRSGGRINPGLAHLLRDYQGVFFTPGPALLAALLLSAAATVLPRLDRRRRALCGLTALAGVGLLAMPSVTAGFDWRYLLPAQVLLAPGGVVGAAALWPRLRGRLLMAAPQPARRVVPALGVVAAIALVAPGHGNSSVYADKVLRPSLSAAVPATLPVGSGLAVTVGKPTYIGTRCQRTYAGPARLTALVAFPVTMTYRSGPSRLVDHGNFVVSHGAVRDPGIASLGRPIQDTVLSHRYPRTHGLLYADVADAHSALRYIDPMGGGAVVWTFGLAAQPQHQPFGTPCTGTAPWAGMQLSYLKVHSVQPFTELDAQQVGYGLGWQPWRADNYDLRFRVSSPTLPPGHWEYPKLWQHTTRTDQTLLRLTPGVTYCFAVRARDELGAATGWSTPRCTTRLFDDASLPFGTDWSRTTGRAGFYAGSYTATSTQGATLSVGGTFSRVAIAAYHCPTCGSVDVYVGSTRLASLNLATKAGVEGLQLWTSPVLPTQQMLTLRVTSSNKVVAIDGVGLTR